MGASEFGELLRRRRDRLSPHAVGLTPTSPRRSAGLRREELAGLAGLSVDYVVRLEQGRATSPSAQVVASLARALQLDRVERDQLFVAAGLAPPRDGTVGTHVPLGVTRLLSRLGDVPIAVFAADWTLLQWSELWAALHGDPTALPRSERNLARAIFGDGSAHASLHPSRSETGAFEQTVVADLRGAVSRYPADQHLAALITELRGASPEFERLWATSTPSAHVAERKTIEHPLVGEITLDCDVLDAPGADVHVVVHTVAPGSAGETRLDLLRMGVQGALMASGGHSAGAPERITAR